MGPRILYELSQELSLLFESRLSGTHERRVPVYFCNPRDVLESEDALEPPAERPSGTFGVLYLTDLLPARQLRRNGYELDPASILSRVARPVGRNDPINEAHADDEGATGERWGTARLRRPDLWIRARYVFLVDGGELEEQMVVFASALQTLHDHPSVCLSSTSDDDRGAVTASHTTGGSSPKRPGRFPMTIVEDSDVWRRLGLSEHRVTLSFEVTCPIPSAKTETVPRIQGRTLHVTSPEGRREPPGSGFAEEVS